MKMRCRRYTFCFILISANYHILKFHVRCMQECGRLNSSCCHFSFCFAPERYIKHTKEMETKEFFYGSFFSIEYEGRLDIYVVKKKFDCNKK